MHVTNVADTGLHALFRQHPRCSESTVPLVASWNKHALYSVTNEIRSPMSRLRSTRTDTPDTGHCMASMSRKVRHLLSDLSISIPNRRLRRLYSPTRRGRRFRVLRYRQSTHLRPLRQKGQTRAPRLQLQPCHSPLQPFPPSQTLAAYPISNSVGNGQTTLKQIHH